MKFTVLEILQGVAFSALMIVGLFALGSTALSIGGII